MTVTANYTAAHTAFSAAANWAGLTPTDVRVLVALDDAGGSATSLELAAALQSEGSMVRRCLQHFYLVGLADGRSVNGGRRRAGHVTQVTLTDSGREVVREARDHWLVLQNGDR